VLPSVLLGQDRIAIAMDTKPVGSVISISKHYGDLEIPLDSLRYRGEQEVTFNYDSRYTDGVYLIHVSTLETFQFILVNKEPLKARIYESGSGMAFKVEGSKENDAFNIMLNLSDVYSQSMDTLNFAMNNLSDFNPRHDAITDSLLGVYHRIADAYNNSLGLVTNLFPESYTAQVLVQLDKIPLRTQQKDWAQKFDNDAAFNHVHYFHYIDFSDPRIISNPFLSNKVMEYMYNYIERTETGILEAIDKLLGSPSMHPQVQGFIMDLLVDFFNDKEATEFVDHIAQKYLGNCDLPLSDDTRARIAKAVKFKVGDAVPDLKIPSPEGLAIPLSAVHGNVKLVVFWASWCPHCLREVPKLKDLYDGLKGQLGVYAVSVDTVKADWTSAIARFGLTWNNVNDLKGWESKNLETFGITSTPSMILIDANNRFIGRATSFDGLYKLVSEQLNP
jgi:thiol-disulfide isomerase/thioredoxin